MRRTLPLVIVLALSCQTASNVQIDDRLFFGRNIPAGGAVSEAQWNAFVRTVITPRFPQGLTIWPDSGQWLDENGKVVREDGYVVEIFHAPSAKADAAMAEIAAEYIKQFGQEAVLRVRSRSELRLYRR